MSHECHAEGCGQPVPPRMFMCKPHWGMVPKAAQRLIWGHYEQGQERRKDPTWDYLYISQRVVEWLAEQEGIDPFRVASDFFQGDADLEATVDRALGRAS